MSDPAGLPTFAAMVLFLAAASITAFGVRQAGQRGWLWWSAAAWLNTAGAMVAAFAQHPAAQWAAGLILLPGPVLMLMGMRVFDSRRGVPGRPAIDRAVLVLAVLLSLAAIIVVPARADAWGAACGAALAVYAALLLWRTGLTAGRDALPVHALAAASLACAACSVWSFEPLGGQAAPLVARVIGAALLTLVMAHVVLILMSERTSRQLRDSRRRLRVLSYMDALTQVPARRHFERMAQAIIRSDPPGSAVLLVLDVDHFHTLNDNLGRAAGDRALTLVSGALLEALRSGDVPGRTSGDTFAVLLRQTAIAQALRVAGRVVQTVQERTAAQRLPQLTLSSGVVQVQVGEDISGALRRASQALQEAKRQGRARAVAAEGDEAEPVYADSRRLGLTPG